MIAYVCVLLITGVVESVCITMFWDVLDIFHLAQEIQPS